MLIVDIAVSTGRHHISARFKVSIKQYIAPHFCFYSLEIIFCCCCCGMFSFHSHVFIRRESTADKNRARKKTTRYELFIDDSLLRQTIFCSSPPEFSCCVWQTDFFFFCKAAMRWSIDSMLSKNLNDLLVYSLQIKWLKWCRRCLIAVFLSLFCFDSQKKRLIKSFNRLETRL